MKPYLKVIINKIKLTYIKKLFNRLQNDKELNKEKLKIKK